MTQKCPVARTYRIHGRVQGVGYRAFAGRTARAMNITGYARNLDNGDVEVYAVGAADQLSGFAGALRQGPRFSDVRGVQEQESPVRRFTDFQIHT